MRGSCAIVRLQFTAFEIHAASNEPHGPVEPPATVTICRVARGTLRDRVEFCFWHTVRLLSICTFEAIFILQILSVAVA